MEHIHPNAVQGKEEFNLETPRLNGFLWKLNILSMPLSPGKSSLISLTRLGLTFMFTHTSKLKAATHFRRVSCSQELICSFS